jgi:26S proteasome regulatory subunit N9
MVVSYVDAAAPVVEHCEQMSAEFPDLAGKYAAIANACQLKLWHPLTLLSLEFCQDPACARLDSSGSHTYLGLYDKVLLVFEAKLNKLSLAVIAGHVATALASVDGTASKAILENLLAKQDANSPPYVYLQSKHAMLLLAQHALSAPPLTPDELDAIHKQIKANSALLEAASTASKRPTAALSGLATMDHAVHAAHYEMCLSYYKLIGPPEAFFSAALMFLQYQPAPSATTPFWQNLGVDLCLAALTGEGVYRNLGHVSDIVSGLIPEDHPSRWLVTLLQVVSSGRVGEFDDIAAQHAQQIQAQPALLARLDAVREKLRLLALVNLVFEKSASDRVVRFDEIAAYLQIPLDQVEWVVMRACSVEILRGSIDEVDQQVHVDWVLPRVLTPDQMRALAARYGTWADQVQSINVYVKEQHAVV